MKSKKYSTVRKSNIKIVERDQIDTLNTRIHDRKISWLDTATSIKSGWVGPTHLLLVK